MDQEPAVPQSRVRFVYEAARLTDEQYESMVAFFRAGTGRAYGFRYTDGEVIRRVELQYPE